MVQILCTYLLVLAASALHGVQAAPAALAGCSTINAAALNIIQTAKTLQTLPDIPFKLPLTQTTAEQLLKQDVVTYTNCVSSYLNYNIVLNENQWGALASWESDVGCSSVRSSTLLRRLNAGQDPNTVAGQELPTWNKVNGVPMVALIHRRAAELTLFQTASTKEAHPVCK
ncbi:hypothetical protein G7Z17_g2598 [Cylindrodendrum hubeiense]|uniref:Uncharacterized protein n=1 Tax=Cylindrodendrum hubeiense TaxID=595255 RepID=A0A9P5LBH9_9HYPO|nr:hypothetical protein G7Z17_g2598 [Cylindrodendrum hubeiense]